MVQDILKDIRLPSNTQKENLTKIGQGLTRTVFRIQGGGLAGKVLKVGTRDDSPRLNKNEIEVWRHARGTAVEEKFCPIDLRYSDMENHKYIVMEYAKKCNGGNAKKMAREIEDKTGICPADCRNENVHTYDGKTVFIDYPWYIE